MDTQVVSGSSQMWTSVATSTMCTCHFPHKWLYLDTFLEVELLGQMVRDFVIWVDIAKLSFTEVLFIYTPTSMSTICSQTLASKLYCQTF